MKSSKTSVLVGLLVIIVSGLLLLVWDAPTISYCTIIGFECVALLSFYYAIEKHNINKTLLLPGLLTINIIGLLVYILIALFASHSFTAIIIVSGIVALMYIVLLYFASRSHQDDEHYNRTKNNYKKCMLLLDQVIDSVSADKKKQLLEVKEDFKLLDLSKDYSFDKCIKILKNMKDGNVSGVNIQDLMDISSEMGIISKQAKLGDI